MNRIDHINKITTYAARFVLEVEGFNANNQYHINIHAESFLIPVLNEVFGLDLENLNATQRKNYPAIDLADFKNRVAFQITATANFEKIKNTLDTFFEKKLDQQFDILYIYILTEKKEKYPDNKLQNIIPETFSFNTSSQILDKDTLLQHINAISATPKLEALAKIYQHEFSDVQLQMRKQKFEFGYLNNEPENLYVNLLEISFRATFFIADVNIDEELITQRINDYLIRVGKKPVKKIKKRKLINNVLREEETLCRSWILHENRIYTFRNLSDVREPLRKVIDIGTITIINSKEYYESNDDASNVFKHLLRNTLMEFCATKGIEWFNEKEVFRFANNLDMPNKKQIKWKGKKEATKTVIFEMMNKKEGHVICYRSLAFKASFEKVIDKWYLTINPTWSFTNPYGYKVSRFEPAYMSGIKRLENNGTVYNYFRFFGYYFTYNDLFTLEYPYLKILPPFTLTISPRLEEKNWRPAKLPEKPISVPSSDLDIDKELDKTLFDL